MTGRSMAQFALAWLCYRPVPVIPIIGGRELPQFEDNLASDLALSARVTIPDQLGSALFWNLEDKVLVFRRGKAVLRDFIFLVLFFVLLFTWATAWIAFHVAGGLIHLLLVVAVISLVLHLFRGGRRAV